METKFQTSFIPKKPLVTETAAHHAPAGTSIFMLLAVIIFICSLGWGGATFLLKGFYLQEQKQHQENLKKNEERFKTPVIEDLSRANTKIDLAKQLLKNHVAVSEALTIVAALTAEKVHFTDFEFSSPGAVATNAQGGATGTYKIRMKGVADGFNSIAFQSNVFGRSQKYGTNKVLKNPILSDLSVDVDGDVKFNFTAELSPEDISYAKVLGETLQEEGSLPSPTSTQ